MSERIILAGGSGFLGRSFAKHLALLGHETLILTRSKEIRPGFAHWDGKNPGEWVRHLEGAKAVVNLAGRSVDCRYTADNRREIVESRVDSARALGEAMRQCRVPPKTWIQAASLAIYGDAGDAILGDDGPHGTGFSAEVCEKWECEVRVQTPPNVRNVILRIGFALATDGGALGRLARLARWGLGGTVGNGRQFISWLHIDDLNRVMAWCIENPNARGTYNATGPSPVANREFMAALRRALGRPWSPPAPAFAVRVGAYFMGTDASLALTGRRCVPTRLLDEGFSLRHVDLNACLRELFPAN